MEISNIDATGENMKVLGRLILAKGHVTLADFKQLKLGAHNYFSLVYTASQSGGHTVEAKGKVIGVSWSNFQEERWKTDEAAMKAAIAAAGDKYISADAQS